MDVILTEGMTNKLNEKKVMKLEGILPAVVTPLDEAGRFAAAPYQALLERVFAAGTHGLYVAGQTGEGLLLPLEDRKRLTEKSMQLLPSGKTVVVHVGAFRTEDAKELARHAAECGATAVSSLPPAGSWSFAEVKEYYRAICESSDLPVIVYYFPEVSAVIRTEEQINELLGLPNVVGLKFTDFDLYRLSRLTINGATVFNGRDEVLAAGLLMGAHGGIGTFYNIIPELFVDVFEHTRAGRWKEARQVQDRVNELIALVLRFPVLPAVKQILTWNGVDAGPCIGPRRLYLTVEEQSALRTGLLASSFAYLAES